MSDREFTRTGDTAAFAEKRILGEPLGGVDKPRLHRVSGRRRVFGDVSPRSEQVLVGPRGPLKPLSVRVSEAADAALKAGYSTTSSSFRQIVNAALIRPNSRLFNAAWTA